jgi:hypothetical protein
MIQLYPRIPRGLFGSVWHDIESRAGDIASLAELASATHPLASYAQTGGHRVSAGELETFRHEIVGLASRYGYPQGGDRASRAAFDTECSVWLAQQASIPTGEALRDDVWSFIAGVLLPDVCRWRFAGELASERYQGGVRNTFQRLWRRSFLLDRGGDAEDRWALVRELTEDAFVSICERPGLSSNPRFARQLAEGWLRTAKSIGREQMENVNRTAVKNLRAVYTVIHPEVLPESEVRQLIDSAYSQATDGLRKTASG